MKFYVTHQEFSVLLCLRVPSYPGQIARRITQLTGDTVERDTISKVIKRFIEMGIVEVDPTVSRKGFAGRPGVTYKLTAKGLVIRESRFESMLALYSIETWLKEKEDNVANDC